METAMKPLILALSLLVPAAMAVPVWEAHAEDAGRLRQG
jgi:hypothetical protein